MDTKSFVDKSSRRRIVHYFSVAIFCCVSATSAIAQNPPLRILKQPKPDLPGDYGMLDVQGTIRLRVEFMGSGKVGKVFPITTMPVSNLIELAVAATKRISFEPETREGQAVAVIRNIEYSYGPPLGGWSIPLTSIQGSLEVDQLDGQAEGVLKKAVQTLGGDKYLNAKSQIGRGKFSTIKDGVNVSFQSFTDVIVFPDKERTEFKGSGVRTVQTNTGASGWVYDGDQDLIKIQNEQQIANFRRGLRTSLDNLLRGGWHGDAELTYAGRRQASLGKRNDVLKLTYKDGLVVEFEFADDGSPQKAIYKRTGADKEEVTEEDRYAQFVETDGIKAPYIIDHVVNGVPSSRINYESIEYNKQVLDSIFAKPSNPKELKKDLKLAFRSAAVPVGQTSSGATAPVQ